MKLGEILKICGWFVCVMLTCGWLVFRCTNAADAAETTTLDEATNRPVKIMKYVDKPNGVVCYWNERHPADIDCVKVTNTSKRHAQ